jgi:diacylglycerol kinase family enzyme
MPLTTMLLVRNKHAGSGDFPEAIFAGFETVELAGLAERLEHAPDGTVVAVWGGDGTVRSVAALAADTQMVVLPCPGGTHNHFSKAAGFETAYDVVDALEQARTTLVDVGIIQSEVFLNNMNIGWYVDLVARRERYQKVMPRRFAKVLSVAAHMGSIRRLRVTIDGRSERVWMIWIGNGRFAQEPGQPQKRESLTDGVLDIRILRAGAKFPKLKALKAILGRQAEDSNLIDQRFATTCTIDFRTARVDVALDGELFHLPTPLHVRTAPKALRVMRPVAST